MWLLRHTPGGESCLQVTVQHYTQLLIMGCLKLTRGVIVGKGNSVCTFVHGFEAYFFIEAPADFGPDDCEPFQRLLNVSTSRHWSLHACTHAQLGMSLRYIAIEHRYVGSICRAQPEQHVTAQSGT